LNADFLIDDRSYPLFLHYQVIFFHYLVDF